MKTIKVLIIRIKILFIQDRIRGSGLGKNGAESATLERRLYMVVLFILNNILYMVGRGGQHTVWEDVK